MTLLWVGLGNPEPQMMRHRHNVGFMALDVIATRHGFQPWRRRFKGAIAEGKIGAEKIIAIKPLTYMNASGEAVQEAASYYKLPIHDIVVFHDDLDLTPGKVRVKKGGGAAGHNGLRSLDRMLGSPDYTRVRLGIGHPGSKERVHDHVLGNFSKEDSEWLPGLLDAIASAASLLAQSRPEEFMTKVALLTQEAL